MTLDPRLTSSSGGSPGSSTCCLMWCLERLRLGPERLLPNRNRLFQGRAGRSTAVTPAACTNVLTPDRIPEFCIPPRLASCPTLAAVRDFWGEKAGTDDAAGHTDWDPRSQAALSLPHLPRARTVDEVRRLAVRVKAENRGRLLGRGELLLGPLLPL
uniref:C2 calcium-dependent domain-containing protein 4A n=1 Tax=Camelus bactrianus TaxID=9837 RepID=A0A9W3FL16_CAMBA|nr:C2 calcium-dependent domain-containing protein 4A [Camelus bactrianus]